MRREIEEDRRAKLRLFLIQQRARLTPEDVGLPVTAHRRVIGLRREEVAELAGVSSDWYRWFESGRPIRVSPPFLARLSDALRLNAMDKRTLYRLSLPELYEAETSQLTHAPLDLTSPIRPGDELLTVLRQVSSARDSFFAHDPRAFAHIRARIALSWERSVSLGVNPAMPVALAAATSAEALAQRRDAKRMLISAAHPVLAHLRNVLEESGYALVMADERGCVLDMWGDREILRALSRIDFEPGTDLSESACGTNAVGTAVADERALQLIGAENFCEGGSDLTCTAAPIRDPQTHRIIGVLDVTANYRDFCPEMIAIVSQAALEIEEHLAQADAEQSQPF